MQHLMRKFDPLKSYTIVELKVIIIDCVDEFIFMSLMSPLPKEFGKLSCFDHHIFYHTLTNKKVRKCIIF